MMNRLIYLIILVVVSFTGIPGCSKFLEKKSDNRLTIPATLGDFQALLDDATVVNGYFCSSGEISSDDFYLRDADYNSLNYDGDKRLYTWQPDYVSRPNNLAGGDWSYCYRGIYVSNAVLFGLDEHKLTGIAADNIKGQALVFRAARYLDAVQIWSPAYSKLTAAQDLGMVIRLDPDMNLPSVRSTVEETYQLIGDDLMTAIPLLPSVQPGVSLPSKGTAHGLLARMHLFKGEYADARKHALEALSLNDTLIDFKTLNQTAAFPIPAVKQASAEVLWMSSMDPAEPLTPNRARITQSLYDLYDANDLRKTVYFQKNTDSSYYFKGTHSGNVSRITSVTAAELLLILAECYVRSDELKEAEDALNRLLIKRWRLNTFVPYTFTSKELALEVVLTERRKELVMRGLRWPDIKRLNKDGANITLSRAVNGVTYLLPPNDLRYAIALSEEMIALSGVQQNPRK